MFKYAEPTQEWEKWQHEYRYGAFYIFPPSGVIETVDSLRKKYDPRTASYCQGHLSLSEPLTEPLNEKYLDEIMKALAGLKPFHIHYGPVCTVPPYPGIVYEIEPKDLFFQLRETLHSTSLFQGKELKRKDYAPHMTIAEFGYTYPESEELVSQIKGNIAEGDFLCSTIEYAIPNENFWFERVLTIPLGQSH